MKINGYIKENLKKRLVEDLEKERGKIVIFSGHELADEDKNILYEKFPRLKGSYIEFAIDKSLIAGVIIKIGSKVIDLSLKGQLKNLEQSIYETGR